jgi:hypothetical protein
MKKNTCIIIVLSLTIAGVLGACEKNEEQEQSSDQSIIENTDTSFQISSPAFEKDSTLPTKYAGQVITGGRNISIPLQWSNAPARTKTFAIAMVDHHEVANNFVHWMVINIPVSATSIPEDATRSESMPTGSFELENSYGSQGYGGPQPPEGTGFHQYEIILYALDETLINDKSTLSWRDFEETIRDHTLAKASLNANFEHP